MPTRKNARLTALALMLVFVSTIAVLLARQFNMGPQRPAPDFRTFGPAGAPLQIYEYTDFACPACRYAAGKLDELLKVYEGRVQLHFKHSPILTIHPWSLHAAAYADCAGRQGKFREYAAMLFEGQEHWSKADPGGGEPPEFARYASELGLDWAAMTACANAPETLRALKLDIAEGDMKGVNATPTFFINGRRAVGSGQLLEEARKFDNILREAASR